MDALVRLSDSVTLIHGDCSEWLDRIGPVDAIVSDPPYGIGYKPGKGGHGCTHKSNTTAIHGDDAPFDPAALLAVASDNRKGNAVTGCPILLFGANHYSQRIPEEGQWLVWDKSCGHGPANSFVDAEFMWMNRRNPRCIYRHVWMGCMRAGEGSSENMRRNHPSQKPVELMMWCLETARVRIGAVVLDPYMGTGTTGVACLRTGRRFVGIEIDGEHFATARARIEKELEQGQLAFEANVGGEA
jgi:DNA modification methylase